MRDFQFEFNDTIHYYISKNPQIWCQKVNPEEEKQGNLKPGTFRSSDLEKMDENEFNLAGKQILKSLFDENEFMEAKNFLIAKKREENIEAAEELIKGTGEMKVKVKKKGKKGKKEKQKIEMDRVPDTSVGN